MKKRKCLYCKHLAGPESGRARSFYVCEIALVPADMEDMYVPHECKFLNDDNSLSLKAKQLLVGRNL